MRPGRLARKGFREGLGFRCYESQQTRRSCRTPEGLTHNEGAMKGETAPSSKPALRTLVWKEGLIMTYRWEATSITGFVQQLACNYLPHGYWFYVTGRIPEGKAALGVDRKLIEKYDIGLCRSKRARRKKAGLANLHYLRFERDWVLLATHGRHFFFAAEGEVVRDIRKHPLHFAGYSLTVKRGDFLKVVADDSEARIDGRLRVRTQIAREQLRMIKAHLLEYATKRSPAWLAYQLWNLPFEPYAPVRKQLLALLRMINSKRQAAGLSKLDFRCLRLRREIVKPFEERLQSAA